MSKRLLSISTLMSLGVCIVLLVHYRQMQSQLKLALDENATMDIQIQESIEKQRDAIIQRRISEQLENIALEQKNLTEEQTRFAIQQRAFAEDRQREAVFQKLKADSATSRAVSALTEAENQRQIAIEQKDIAETERLKSEASERRANQLRQLALSQSLSIQAVNQQEAGNAELAVMLAAMGWNYATENGGDPYQPDLFTALKKASGEDVLLRGHTDHIRDLATANDLLVSVSQNGEIKGWTFKAGNFEVVDIYTDRTKDFRKVALSSDGKYLVAGDMTGVVLIIEGPLNTKATTPFNLSNKPISGVLFLDDETVLFADNSGLIGKIGLTEGFPYEIFYQHDSPIASLAYDQSSGTIVFGDSKREIHVIPSNQKRPDNSFEVPSDVSAIAIESRGYIAVGDKEGRIYLYNPETSEVNELVGHISGVNALAFAGANLLSTSYDQTVRLWNMAGPNIESIVVNTLDEWGYGLTLLDGKSKVAVAGADRTIRIDTIDPEVLARLIRSKLKRDFTPEEWAKFIGQASPYQKIMNEE